MALTRIVDARESWAEEFEDIKNRLIRILGPIALRIDHIGSTSVPGLPSKDVIDVQVTVEKLDRAELDAAFAGTGFRVGPGGPYMDYDHLPPGAADAEEWAKIYVREPAGERIVHIHVRIDGHANERYALLFRDYLRVHPHAMASYAAFKERLAAVQLETGIYAEIKDPVCDLIMIAAETWATETGWGTKERPPESSHELPKAEPDKQEL